MRPAPLELVCHGCDAVLRADTEDELVDLAVKHTLSIHGHAPPRQHVLARIHLHNL